MTMTHTPARPRRSGGGNVVEDSLRAVGFDVATPGVALVEAKRPERRPLSKVLVQNAWTVLPSEDFDRLAAPYPLAWRTRMLARRAVTRLNLHRADHVVCLTHAMGDLVRKATRTPVHVAPVSAPMDIWAQGGNPPVAGHEDMVLVPGTITWYKRPQLALDIAARLGSKPRETPLVLFAGRDDGSGAWQRTQAEARRLGLDVAASPMTRTEMKAALRTAMVTVIPSELESLSLSLSEALMLSRRVIASSLTVHREIADAVGREPEWLETRLPTDPPETAPASLTEDEARAAWVNVGRTLELSSLAEDGLSQ